MTRRLAAASPLVPYPGGKWYARGVIGSRLPFMTGEVVSPFLGGGSVELWLSERGVRVHGSDIWGALVNLWQHALSSPGVVADLVEREYTPPCLEHYEKAGAVLAEAPGGIEEAAAFYAVARMSYNGLSSYSGYSSAKKRLTPLQVERLRRFSAPGLDVQVRDWRESLEEWPDLVAYLDPPYPQGRRNLYQGHREFTAETLVPELRVRSAPWLLSYPDLPDVREAFSWARVEPVSWMGSMKFVDGGRRWLSEVLVSNY